ncbi:MAG: DUF2182 domain-containing protein [Alphaproteobacteria bacterium]|nr:DUF2182 domain-containing protein [Alphaproteobacteria bacterium]
MSDTNPYHEGWLRRRIDDPRPLAWAGIVILTAAGWAFLGTMAAVQSGAGGLGNSYAVQLIISLCTVSASAWTSADLALAVLMWSAMAFAMMLPAGAPLLATYMDIAGAAKAKQMPVVSPSVLIAGYMVVWLVFAVAAGLVQGALALLGALSPEMFLVHPVVGAAVLIGAGAWQFTPTKHQCLSKCRRPFTWFMANWKDDEIGVFKLGLEQGLICLACCWALMAVMFVAGLMNLFWMAALATVMVLEKTVPNPKPLVYGTGVVLIAGGVGLLASQIV